MKCRMFSFKLMAIVLIAIGLNTVDKYSSASSQSRFDKLNEEDRETFSKRFAKEFWPLFIRNGKDGCAGCHNADHRSGLRFTGKANADFRMLLREGFLLPNDAGSVVSHLKSKDPRIRMPPGKRPRWSAREVQRFQDFVLDVDKKQKK